LKIVKKVADTANLRYFLHKNTITQISWL